MPYRYYTAAQKRAYALKMAKRRKGGKAAYKRVLYSKAKSKVARANVRQVVKAELSKRVETFMNASRLNQGLGQTPTTGNFGGTVFFFGNIGGSVPVAGQSFVPMETIAAQNIIGAAGISSATNQSYKGKEIYGKNFHSTVTLALPSIRTQPTGTADWQQLPINYEYRAIFFKTKHRPGAGTTQSGQQQAPMYNLLSNEVGTKFGPLSPNTDCVIPVNPTTPGIGQWLNNDLMRMKTNRVNWQILHEKRGKLSVNSSMNATNNNASVTSGASRYPSETVIHFNMPINRKIQLDTDDNPPADVTELQTALDYNNSIYMAIFLNPCGEPATYEATWNNAIAPYINISNTFSWTDM